ncbi:ATP-binding protein [Kribbella sp. NPDC050470]|uniref:ATP-binding protein n=1 Tax=unclassified Kribbella TaxID=2644121 RepID=UPI00378C63F3
MERRVMVGRAGPLADLGHLLAAAFDGRGRSAVVLGEPGMGKTTLAEALADQATEAGATVAWGWCSAAGVPPFWPWRTIFRELAPRHRLAAEQPAGTAADGLGVLRGDAGARARLFVTVVDTLQQVSADRPVVIVLEDLQWADSASLLLLRQVVDALPGLRVLLVATCRDEPAESGDEALAVVRELPTAVQRIRLDGLELDEVAELVSHGLGHEATDELAALVHGRTGGNPFFVREVSRLLAARPPTAGVPEGVREVLARRIARVSQDCQAMLEIAAVAGNGADVCLVSAVSEAPVGVELLEEAATARLLAGPATDGRMYFTHDLVREVLDASLGAARRAGLHRALAEQLEATATDEDEAAGELARHWSAAFGPDATERAATWALRAARAARSRMGYEQAADSYRIALRGKDIERTKVMLELGEAQIYAGDLAGARQTFAQTADVARRNGRASHLAMAALGLGTGLGGFEVPQYDELQLELLSEALASLPNRDGGLRAAVMGRLSLAYAGTDREGERLELARSAVAMAERVGHPCVEAGALAAYCDAVAGPGHVDERSVAAGRMLAVAERGHDSPCQLLARRLRLVALMERGDWPAVDAEIDAFARTSDRVMLPLYAWYVPLWRGARALMSGDFETALRYAGDAEAIGLRAGSANAGLMVATLRLWTHRTAGELPASHAGAVDELIRTAEESTVAMAMGASYFAAADDLQKSRRFFDRLTGRGLDAIPDDCEWLEGMWHAGDAAIALGRDDVARDVSRRLAPYEELWVVDGIGGGVMGTTAHILGRLAAYLGDTGEARRLLAKAVTAYEGANAVPWRTMAEKDLAAIGVAVRPATRVEGMFRPDGRTWRVRWRDGEASVPDSKGMHDLSVLLGRPGEPVHVLDLVAAAGGPARTAAGGDTGPILDSTARASYKRRLAELETAIAEGTSQRVETLTEERDFLVHELAAAYGLAGRVRTTGDQGERARKAVAMRIATAIRAIRAVHPALAHHLELAVSTGRFCVYRPEENTTWHT